MSPLLPIFFHHLYSNNSLLLPIIALIITNYCLCFHDVITDYYGSIITYYYRSNGFVIIYYY